MENERRTLIAIFISIVIVMLYSETILAPYTRQALTPPQPQPTAVTNSTPSASQAPLNTTQITGAPGAVVPPQVAQPTRPHPSPAEIAASPAIIVETDKFIAKITLLGGRLLEFKLKAYKKELNSKDPLEMIQTVENGALPLGVYAASISDDFVNYNLDGATGGFGGEGRYTLRGSDELNLKLSGTLPNGSKIEKAFKFSAKSYLFDLNVALSQPTSDGSKAWLEWVHFDPHAAKSGQFNFMGFINLAEEKVTHHIASDVSTDLTLLGSTNWLSYTDRYFMTTMIPALSSQNAAIRHDGDVYIGRVGGSPSGGQFRIYVGPKDYTLLKDQGLGLERNIDLGWFTFLAYPLLVALRSLYKLFGNYGLSIVLLTILIKTAFLPLTKSSFKSMAAMTKIQPEMQAMRQRYKDDPAKINQEMLALYKRHGVNPLGGCFPILIQIPVFLGLYNSLLYAIELRHAPFALWINDLSAPENLVIAGLPIPVMVILMGIMMLVQQWLTPAPDPTQKKIMMFFTVFLSFIFVSFPSGLVLYWLVNNTISVVQQACIRQERMLTPGKATALVGIGLFVFAYILTII